MTHHSLGVLVVVVILLLLFGGYYYAPGPWRTAGAPAPAFVMPTWFVVLLIVVALFWFGIL